jgi:hypothetical protein
MSTSPSMCSAGQSDGGYGEHRLTQVAATAASTWTHCATRRDRHRSSPLRCEKRCPPPVSAGLTASATHARPTMTRVAAPGRCSPRVQRQIRALRGRRVHSISNFLSLLAVRVARDERQEIVQRHGEITPGVALCIAVECAAVISELGLFDR